LQLLIQLPEAGKTVNHFPDTFPFIGAAFLSHTAQYRFKISDHSMPRI
jgi:hypothetical protein